MNPQNVCSRRNRVLHAAADLFLETGYRVAMEAVAQRAGVSKQTVYAHFGSKQALFRAVLGHLLEPLHASLELPHANLRTTLEAFAAQHLEQLFDERNIAMWRVLIGEAPRFPAEARTLFDATIGVTRQRLAARLEQAMVSGELDRHDPAAAAETLLALLAGLESYRLLLGISGPTRRRDYAVWVRHAVNLFLDAYRVRTTSSDHQECP